MLDAGSGFLRASRLLRRRNASAITRPPTRPSRSPAMNPPRAAAAWTRSSGTARLGDRLARTGVLLVDARSCDGGAAQDVRNAPWDLTGGFFGKWGWDAILGHSGCFFLRAKAPLLLGQVTPGSTVRGAVARVTVVTPPEGGSRLENWLTPHPGAYKPRLAGVPLEGAFTLPARERTRAHARGLRDQNLRLPRRARRGRFARVAHERLQPTAHAPLPVASGPESSVS